jgi:hypothetical protein
MLGRRTSFDVLVVGAGPSGLTTAVALARAGGAGARRGQTRRYVDLPQGDRGCARGRWRSCAAGGSRSASARPYCTFEWQWRGHGHWPIRIRRRSPWTPRPRRPYVRSARPCSPSAHRTTRPAVWRWGHRCRAHPPGRVRGVAPGHRSPGRWDSARLAVALAVGKSAVQAEPAYSP